jgi:hypothetical protein
VEFTNGRSHDFPAEPEEYQALLHAQSAGRHFNAYIRGRRHVRVA